MNFAAYFLILEIFACMGCLAQATKNEERVADALPKLERMPESLEIRFALSAALHICETTQRHMCCTPTKDMC